MFPLNVEAAAAGADSGEETQFVTIAGNNGTGSGGYLRGSYGSINPDELIFGDWELTQLNSFGIGGIMNITSSDAGLLQDAWTRVVITGTFVSGPGTETLFSVAANYNDAGNWNFSGAEILVTGQAYQTSFFLDS